MKISNITNFKINDIKKSRKSYYFDLYKNYKFIYFKYCSVNITFYAIISDLLGNIRLKIWNKNKGD